jgi:amino acid transporter
MARDGLFPSAIRQIHGRFQTPANAIIAQTAWSLVLIAIAYAWSAVPPVKTANTEASAFAAAIATPAHPARRLRSLDRLCHLRWLDLLCDAVAAVFVLQLEAAGPGATLPDVDTIHSCALLVAIWLALVSMLVAKLPQTLAGSVLTSLAYIAFTRCAGSRPPSTRI